MGIVEGAAQAIQNIVQGASGWYSDRQRRRKPIALAGYLVAALAKPLIGLSSSWPGVLGARSLDRLGAGVRSAPRDALVAASADEAHRGKAFGLEGVGDNLGACLGPLITVALLGWFAVGMRSIFLLALIPGLVACALVLLVRESPAAAPRTTTADLRLRDLPRRYWSYLAITALFGIGNSSNSFLILQSKQLGASLTMTILVYAAFNLVAAAASYPAGYVSDEYGRKHVLFASLAIFAIVYAGFGFASRFAIVGSLFVLYGVFQGIYRAVGKALAVDFLPAELHASGVGLFSATVGLSGLAANLIGAACAVAGCIALAMWTPPGASSR